MRIFTAAILVCAMTATSLAAKPPLREVQEIDDMVMVIAIALKLRKSCDDISARWFRGHSTANELKSRARALGYSEDEIDEYVTSKTEKKRLRAKAVKFLAENGVPDDDKAAFCSFGRRQIQSQTDIGRLLR